MPKEQKYIEEEDRLSKQVKSKETLTLLKSLISSVRIQISGILLLRVKNNIFITCLQKNMIGWEVRNGIHGFNVSPL